MGGQTRGHVLGGRCDRRHALQLPAARRYHAKGLRSVGDITGLTGLAESPGLPDGIYRYLLRIPEQLRQKLSASAAEAGRSFNAEVRHRLEQSFESEHARRAPILRRRAAPNQGRNMSGSTPPRRGPRWAVVGVLVAALVAIAAGSALGISGDAIFDRGQKAKTPSEFGTAPLTEAGSTAELLARNDFFMSRRTAGTIPLDNQQAGALRAEAARTAARLRKEGTPPSGPATFNSAWTGIGPNPIAQITRNPDGGIIAAMAGRIGALAIRERRHAHPRGRAGRHLALDKAATDWMPKTDNLPSLAMGALAVAPSNDAWSTPAPARATSRVTATSATAS